MTKKNVDVEFDNDVGYPYHLQPDIIKMALFIQGMHKRHMLLLHTPNFFA